MPMLTLLYNAFRLCADSTGAAEKNSPLSTALSFCPVTIFTPPTISTLYLYKNSENWRISQKRFRNLKCTQILLRPELRPGSLCMLGEFT